MHLEDAAKLMKMGMVSPVFVSNSTICFWPQGIARTCGRFARHLPRQRLDLPAPQLFSALRTEKRMMWLILFLIVAVAAFNIVSALVMAVTDKQSDIAILRTLGISPASISWIFIVRVPSSASPGPSPGWPEA